MFIAGKSCVVTGERGLGRALRFAYAAQGADSSDRASRDDSTVARGVESLDAAQSSRRRRHRPWSSPRGRTGSRLGLRRLDVWVQMRR